MNTNSIPYWDKVLKADEILRVAPAGILVFALCIAIGYVWRAIRICPNRFTPLVVMIFGAGFNLALNWSPVDRVRYLVAGFILGFAAWATHRLIIKRIEDKFGGKLDDEDEPPAIPKPTKDDYKP